MVNCANEKKGFWTLFLSRHSNVLKVIALFIVLVQSCARTILPLGSRVSARPHNNNNYPIEIIRWTILGNPNPHRQSRWISMIQLFGQFSCGRMRNANNQNLVMKSCGAKWIKSSERAACWAPFPFQIIVDCPIDSVPMPLSLADQMKSNSQVNLRYLRLIGCWFVWANSKSNRSAMVSLAPFAITANSIRYFQECNKRNANQFV